MLLNYLSCIIISLSLFLLSTVLVKIFCLYATRHGLLDIPNERSSHQEIVPRGGGIVFVLLWLLSVLGAFGFHILSSQLLFLLLPSTLLISLLGFWDDYQNISPKKRLMVQIGIAIGSVLQLGDLSVVHLFSHSTFYLGGVGIGLATLGLVWSTNVFNFMDGLDGIAAVEAIFIFGVGGFLFWKAGGMDVAVLSWALVGGVAGFLVWNLPKAKVFMGDVGSYCLGFLVALFAFIGDKYYRIPLTVWIVLYGAFWFDATVTLLRRLWKGETLSMAHREHAYQRLHRAGFSTWQILLGLILLNSILGSLVLFSNVKREYLGWSVLLTIIILSFVYGVIERLKPMVKAT